MRVIHTQTVLTTRRLSPANSCTHTMKVLIFISCALAVASAGWAPYAYAPWAQHVPVIGPNGVPLETPEVQAAKAHHYAAHAEANARAGHLGAISLAHAYGVPTIAHNGLPLDTPEVAAAKIQHHQDFAVAAQRNGVHVVAPVLVASAHPIDTPEVQIAKAAHFQAHAEAAARNAHGLVHYRKRRGIYNNYPQHIPVIDQNGVPVETPEVQAAKAHHFAAVADAAARSGHGLVGAGAPVYRSAYSHVYPTLAADGQPIETPEVQAAKAHHFAAHADANTRAVHYGGPDYSGQWAYNGPLAVLGPNGVPLETPEVQHAKAAHLAAHSAALGHGHYY